MKVRGGLIQRTLFFCTVHTRISAVPNDLELVLIRPNQAIGACVSVVEQFLANLEVGVGAFAACDIRKGFQLTFDARPTASLHYCLAGRGTMRCRSGDVILIKQHSFILLPPNIIYTIGANTREELGGTPRRRLRAPLFKESVPTIRAGEGKPGILTACGEVRFAELSIPGLFTHLDKPMVEQFDGPAGLREQFIILLAESARPGIGTRPLTEALLKQCLILLLRRKIERGTAPIPWMAALTEPGLTRAMQAILGRFSEPFTVEILASIAGMSRSAFAARFTGAFGRTPMDLLKSVRLRRARELLATTNESIAQIANRIGFSSRSHFSRAFRTAHRMDPTKFRANALVE